MTKQKESKKKPSKKITKSKRGKTKKVTKSRILDIPLLPAEKVQIGLEKHGFPLELQCRNILRKSGWSVNSDVPYLDYDIEKEKKIERTIDIVALRKQDLKSDVLGKLEIRLIIECKQQKDSAWVFEKGKKRAIDWDDPIDARVYCRDSFLTEFGDDRWNEIFKLVGMMSHQVPERKEELALSGVTYRESKRGKPENEPDLLHKGSRQVMSAIDYLTKKLEERSPPEVNLEGLFVPLFWRSYPVLVFRGAMFYAALDKGEMKLEEIKYAHLYPKTTQRWYLIDVVRSDYLEEYLKIIDQEFEISCEALDGVTWKTTK